MLNAHTNCLHSVKMTLNACSILQSKPVECCIVENFRVRNFRKLVKSTIFAKKTFTNCLLLPPQNFMEKTFTNSHKTAKFTTVFSLESFLLYGSHINFKYTSSTCLPTCIHTKLCGKYMCIVMYELVYTPACIPYCSRLN